MSMKIAILPGDGIGPEVVAQAVKVLEALNPRFELQEAPVGGSGYAAHGHPLPENTLDLLIIRDLTGDVYFGEPRGIRQSPDGPFEGCSEGFDTMRYSEPEIVRVAHVAFQAAQKRSKRLCSVDKANMLETSQF